MHGREEAYVIMYYVQASAMFGSLRKASSQKKNIPAYLPPLWTPYFRTTTQRHNDVPDLYMEIVAFYLIHTHLLGSKHKKRAVSCV